MSENAETILKLVIPDVLEIEFKGKTEYVQKYFKDIQMAFMDDLAKSLARFSGTLTMTERRRGKTVTLDVKAQEAARD
jgi:hypothetical protein